MEIINPFDDLTINYAWNSGFSIKGHFEADGIYREGSDNLFAAFSVDGGFGWYRARNLTYTNVEYLQGQTRVTFIGVRPLEGDWDDKVWRDLYLRRLRELNSRDPMIHNQAAYGDSPIASKFRMLVVLYANDAELDPDRAVWMLATGSTTIKPLNDSERCYFWVTRSLCTEGPNPWHELIKAAAEQGEQD